MNKIKVSVLEKDYVLQTPESEEYVQRLAKQIDRGIRTIMSADASMSITSACILWAFDATDAHMKLKVEEERVREQIATYEEQAKTAIAAAEAAEKQKVILEAENTALKNKLELYSLKEKLEQTPDAAE